MKTKAIVPNGETLKYSMKINSSNVQHSNFLRISIYLYISYKVVPSDDGRASFFSLLLHLRSLAESRNRSVLAMVEPVRCKADSCKLRHRLAWLGSLHVKLDYSSHKRIRSVKNVWTICLFCALYGFLERICLRFMKLSNPNVIVRNIRLP